MKEKNRFRTLFSGTNVLCIPDNFDFVSLHRTENKNRSPTARRRPSGFCLYHDMNGYEKILLTVRIFLCVAEETIIPFLSLAA